MNLLDEIDRADLMCGDTVAAHIQSRAVIPVEPNLVPLCFVTAAISKVGWNTGQSTLTAPIPVCSRGTPAAETG